MSNSTKLESMLNFVCQEVYETVFSNLNEAIHIVDDLEYFENFRELFHFSIEENASILEPVVLAASISDVLRVLVNSIYIDSHVDEEELFIANELLKDSLHRYCWLSNYKKYEYIIDNDDFSDFISQWMDDTSELGGDSSHGAVINPFRDFIMLACFINENTSLFITYKKVILLVAKFILESDGVTQEEQEYYDQLSKSLSEHENLLSDCFQNSTKDTSDRTLVNVNKNSEKEIDFLPSDALSQGIEELNSLIGLDNVKAEVSRLTNFLKVRQQRLDQGMPVSTQSLHFVFTGNPGTGKTTVARIIAKILYGFQILKTANLIEADRATMVGGYVGQTAIKTSEVIENATDGVLFIDEAYTLSKSKGEDYGQEAIDTLLKKMEDLRDSLVVIAAGYPNEMESFIHSNPGLESRFTRYIEFDDYHISDLCQIFELMCKSNAYELTQEARGNLAIIFNRIYLDRENSSGNARYVRNAFERTLGNHSDRLATSDNPEITRKDLSTIEAEDLPFDLTNGMSSEFDLSDSKWLVQCPKCEKKSNATLSLLGQVVKCKFCETKFRCPWWNLDKKTVPGLIGFQKFERPMDMVGYDIQMPQ